jgi:surface protein
MNSFPLIIALLGILGLLLAASVVECYNAVDAQPGGDNQQVRREQAATGTARIQKGTPKTACKKKCSASFTSIIDLRNAIDAYPGNKGKFGSINEWCFPGVTDLSNLFMALKSASSFNENISCWDVSKVTNMAFMFDRAAAFDQDISKWKVSKVTNMRGMFNNAAAFNHDIGKWKVSQVTDMSVMFLDALAFDQDISKWKVSKVTDMSSMFKGASSFSQNLCPWGPKMKISGIQKVSFMFDMSGCDSKQSPVLSAMTVAPLCSSTCPA